MLSVLPCFQSCNAVSSAMLSVHEKGNPTDSEGPIVVFTGVTHSFFPREADPSTLARRIHDCTDRRHQPFNCRSHPRASPQDGPGRRPGAPRSTASDHEGAGPPSPGDRLSSLSDCGGGPVLPTRGGTKRSCHGCSRLPGPQCIEQDCWSLLVKLLSPAARLTEANEVEGLTRNGSAVRKLARSQKEEISGPFGVEATLIEWQNLGPRWSSNEAPSDSKKR